MNIRYGKYVYTKCYMLEKDRYQQIIIFYNFFLYKVSA